MDPLSHALIGGLTAKTVGTSKRRFWMMVLISLTPDLDVLANGFGPWAAALQHRGLTHSLLGVAVMSLTLSWVLSAWDQGPFVQRSFDYSYSLFSHLLTDMLTNFGVPLLAPFTFREYCLDLVGSVSVLPIVVLAAGLCWIYYREKSGWRSTSVLWIFLGLYLTMTITTRSYAGSLFPAGVTPIPSTMNPFTWRAVEPSLKDHAYHTFHANLLTGQEWQDVTVPMPQSEFPVQVSSRSELVKEFINENRWPVARILPRPGGWRVEWGTLLFSTRGLVRGKVAVEVSSAGEIISEQRIFGFWNPD